MNTYDKIYFENFRKKFAYEKAMNLIKKVNEVIGGVCDTKEKANLLKSTTKVATSIALAIGSILSDKRRDFHYKVAIGQGYSLSKLLAETQSEDFKDCNKIIEEIIKLLRTYRKQLRTKESKQMKKVEIGDKLDINKIQEMVDGLKDSRTLKAYERMIVFYTRLYDVLKALPFFEQYSIFSQTQRAAESIIANLSEGNARGQLGYKLVEANFYSVSFGSAVEVQTWLDIMRIKKYISEEEHRVFDSMLEEVKRLIIVYIKKVAVA